MFYYSGLFMSLSLSPNRTLSSWSPLELNFANFSKIIWITTVSAFGRLTLQAPFLLFHLLDITGCSF